MQAKASIQMLQDSLMKEIIDTIWNGKVDIPWTQNREISLIYGPYISYWRADGRTYKFCFRYRLDSNKTVPDDRITAIADGVLILKKIKEIESKLSRNMEFASSSSRIQGTPTYIPQSLISPEYNITL